MTGEPHRIRCAGIGKEALRSILTRCQTNEEAADAIEALSTGAEMNLRDPDTTSRPSIDSATLERIAGQRAENIAAEAADKIRGELRGELRGFMQEVRGLIAGLKPSEPAKKAKKGKAAKQAPRAKAAPIADDEPTLTPAQEKALAGLAMPRDE